jgi:hypothetical protein
MPWDLQPGERGVLIGMTGTGKSTLATELIRRFLAGGANRRALVIDSKPRYRASYELRGLRQRYTNWVHGDTLPDSVAVQRPINLGEAWKLYRVVILQSATPDGHLVGTFEDDAAIMSAEAFRRSGESNPVLVYIDEYYDILKGALAGIADKRILKTIRAGRERNLSVLVGAQRPRSIPIPTLTEATKMYLFHLEFGEDVTYLMKHGAAIDDVPTGHSFVYYERKFGGEREVKLMQLRLAS